MLENPAPALSPSVSPALTSHHPLPIPLSLFPPFLSPPGRDSSKEMLRHLVMASIGNHPNVASVKVKAFMAKMLPEFPSREPVRRVFNQAFETSLRTMKEWLEKYSSPDFRVDHDETEAIQHLNLHSAVYDGKDLLWLLERMIELRIANTALKEWSEETVSWQLCRGHFKMMLGEILHLAYPLLCCDAQADSQMLLLPIPFWLPNRYIAPGLLL